MTGFRVGRTAEESLIRIYIHSLKRFGRAQAERIEAGFTNVFSLIAAHPGMGAAREDIAPGYRRHVWKAHSIYYRVEADGVVGIIDILGPGEDPTRRFGLSSDADD